MSKLLPIAASVQYSNTAQNGLSLTAPDRSEKILDVPNILTIVAALSGAAILFMEAIKFLP
jgi:hypothetical protein